jgi:hypothetical protein
MNLSNDLLKLKHADQVIYTRIFINYHYVRTLIN